MKKVFVITGARSEFGLIKNLLIKLKKSKKLNAKLIVTGSHLSKKYGNSLNEIKQEKITVYKKVKIINENIKKNNLVIDTTSSGLLKFHKLFLKEKPNLIIIPCDRYEMLSAALAAFYLNIPIAHIFGGETTLGSQDETIRHMLTKISTYHFVTHEIHRKRVIQLGEESKRVFLVGNMAIDNILNTKLYNLKEIKNKIEFSKDKKNVLITFHPITNMLNETENQFRNLIRALSKIKNVNYIFTSPNADQGSLKIIKMIRHFAKGKKNVHFYQSLGHKLYYSVLKKIDCVVGNSSSAMSEGPFLGAISINVGNRQKFRVQPGRVLNVEAEEKKIVNKINFVLNTKKLFRIKDNAYLRRGATEKIIKVLHKLNLDKIVIKRFNDLKFKF